MKKRMNMILATALGLGLAFSMNVSAANYKPEYKCSVTHHPQTVVAQAGTKFTDLVRERTGGRINIKCYFSGQLHAGMQTNEFLILRQGVADFAIASTLNWSPVIKELNLFNLPFLFPDYRTFDAALAGEPGKRILQIIAEKGVIGIEDAWGENGFRELTNSKRPVRTPQDLEGLKIRVVGSPIFVDIFRALGANPVSMNWNDAITAFQQGTVDAQENPINIMAIAHKLYEYHKYFTFWRYTIDPIIMTVNKTVWDSFEAKDKDIIAEAAREAMMWQKKEARKGLEGSTDAIDFLKSKGVDVVVLTKEERETFKVKTKSVYDKWTAEIGPDLVNATENAVQGASK